jgi:hypothetical protein
MQDARANVAGQPTMADSETFDAPAKALQPHVEAP